MESYVKYNPILNIAKYNKKMNTVLFYSFFYNQHIIVPFYSKKQF